MMYVKKEIQKLPTTPGVYIYRNDKNRIIYIGKAISIRDRVKSYFQDSRFLDAKTTELVKHIAKVEHLNTGSEIEALILEAELIKRYKPKYNIVWRDDKNFVYIKITNEDYPQVSLVRQIVDDKAKYIGPFVSAGAVRGLLRYIRKIFMFRHCNYELKRKKDRFWTSQNDKKTGVTEKSAGMTPLRQGFAGQAKRKVCLQYSIGNCSGPCEKYITKAEYNKNIRQMVKLFQGKTKEIEREFKKEMKLAAKSEDFERAVLYRNRVMWLKKIRTIELDKDSDSGQARMTRDKALVGLRDALDLGVIPKRIECYDISNIFGKAAVGSMVVFVDGIPARGHYRRFEIKTVKKISDTDMIREVLRRRFSKVKSKKEKVKIDSGQARMTKVKKIDESFSQIPDLIIIDGGKGQLSVAEKTLNQYGLNLNLVSLAKRREEIFRIDSGPSFAEATERAGKARMTRKGDQNDPRTISKRGTGDSGRFQKITLEEGSESLYLVQRIRDEAHRFAITYHRSKRGQEMVVSNLDVVDGIGPKTKKKLIREFGSVEAIRKAKITELSEVVGEKVAQKIKSEL